MNFEEDIFPVNSIYPLRIKKSIPVELNHGAVHLKLTQHCKSTMCVCVSVVQLCPTLFDPMDYIARQSPLFMGFPRQGYWSG